MKNTRHEEYVRFDDGLPFGLQIGLRRTPTNCSTAKNWHENVEFQLCTDGQGEVLLDGEKYEFRKGDIVAVNSNVIHYTGTTGYLEYSCLIVDMSFCEEIGIDHKSLSFSPIIQSGRVRELFGELTAIYAEKTDPYRVARLNESVIKLLIEVCRNHTTKGGTVDSKAEAFENVKATIKFLRENFHRRLSLDEISKNVYTDKYVLSREFKKITGQTIVGYVNNYRCKKAAEYIREGVGVTEAAWRCGFENMSFFSKTFKRYMGKLPSKFKK